jgi:purine-binding chemotaxis protein CheW
MPTESYRNKSTTQKKNEIVQLLTFKLDDQEYALNIANVVQVVRMVALTRPPKAPDYMEGLFNLRGKIIPVVNVRARYGLPTKPHDLDTQLLIAKANGHTLAITVDTVSEVLTLPIDSLERPEAIGPEMQYLSAVGKVGERLILILEPNLLMADAAELTQTLGSEKMEMAA